MFMALIGTLGGRIQFIDVRSIVGGCTIIVCTTLFFVLSNWAEENAAIKKESLATDIKDKLLATIQILASVGAGALFDVLNVFSLFVSLPMLIIATYICYIRSLHGYE